ncbi:MAG: hypothetical protein M1834_001026 [Cirrosporium novae-zelandiae]|nr:MAG: hypothetical protein M1834_001026 [Cirrosporium novae-zelandiae]
MSPQDIVSALGSQFIASPFINTVAKGDGDTIYFQLASTKDAPTHDPQLLNEWIVGMAAVLGFGKFQHAKVGSNYLTNNPLAKGILFAFVVRELYQLTKTLGIINSVDQKKAKKLANEKAEKMYDNVYAARNDASDPGIISPRTMDSRLSGSISLLSSMGLLSPSDCGESGYNCPS